MFYDTKIEDNLGPGIYAFMPSDMVLCVGESKDLTRRLHQHKGSCGMMNIISIEKLPNLTKKNRESREQRLLHLLTKKYGQPLINTHECFLVDDAEHAINYLKEINYYGSYTAELTEVNNIEHRDICEICKQHPVATIQKGFTESPFDADKRRHRLWYEPFPSINAIEPEWKNFCHNCHKRWQAFKNSVLIEKGDEESIERWKKSMGKIDLFDDYKEEQGVLQFD